MFAWILSEQLAKSCSLWYFAMSLNLYPNEALPIVGLLCLGGVFATSYLPLCFSYASELTLGDLPQNIMLEVWNKINYVSLNLGIYESLKADAKNLQITGETFLINLFDIPS